MQLSEVLQPKHVSSVFALVKHWPLLSRLQNAVPSWSVIKYLKREEGTGFDSCDLESQCLHPPFSFSFISLVFVVSLSGGQLLQCTSLQWRDQCLGRREEVLTSRTYNYILLLKTASKNNQKVLNFSKQCLHFSIINNLTSSFFQLTTDGNQQLLGVLWRVHAKSRNSQAMVSQSVPFKYSLLVMAVIGKKNNKGAPSWFHVKENGPSC